MTPKPCCGCEGVAALVTNKKFELFVTLLIILNTISLAVEFDHMPQEMIDVLAIVNYVFTGIFALEMILKLIGCL